MGLMGIKVMDGFKNRVFSRHSRVTELTYVSELTYELTAALTVCTRPA